MGSNERTPDTAELRAAAREAARQFELPADWTENRKFRSGIALVEQPNDVVDKVISLDETAETTVLCVSIPDTGTFLRGNDAIVDYALRADWASHSPLVMWSIL